MPALGMLREDWLPKHAALLLKAHCPSQNPSHAHSSLNAESQALPVSLTPHHVCWTVLESPPSQAQGIGSSPSRFQSTRTRAMWLSAMDTVEKILVLRGIMCLAAQAHQPALGSAIRHIVDASSVQCVDHHFTITKRDGQKRQLKVVVMNLTTSHIAMTALLQRSRDGIYGSSGVCVRQWIGFKDLWWL